jgi:hypothetical protein
MVCEGFWVVLPYSQVRSLSGLFAQVLPARNGSVRRIFLFALDYVLRSLASADQSRDKTHLRQEEIRVGRCSKQASAG